MDELFAALADELEHLDGNLEIEDPPGDPGRDRRQAAGGDGG